MAKKRGLIRNRDMVTSGPRPEAEGRGKEQEPGPISIGTSKETIRSHKDLIVWQKAMELAVMAYKFTKTFPASEQYALVAQIRRCAASVPANIAEGRGRYTTRDFANFVSIAKGSLMELETLLLLAIRLSYLKDPEAKPALDLIVEISKMLTALSQRLKMPELRPNASRLEMKRPPPTYTNVQRRRADSAPGSRSVKTLPCRVLWSVK